LVALLILKHVRNLSDESLVEQWTENTYISTLSGALLYTWVAPATRPNWYIFATVSEQKGLSTSLEKAHG